MPERIQLKDPGSELVMLVKSVSPETVERNDYFLFGNGSKELLVPQSSVMGQISRLGVNVAAELVGKTVKFSRSTKMSRAGKPYWNVDLASGAESAPSVQSAAGNPPAANAVAPSAEPAKPKMRDAYKSITEWVLKEIAPIYEGAQIGMSPESAAACVQTLFIQACNAGKVE